MPYGNDIPVKPSVMIVRLGCEKLEPERFVSRENHATSAKHLLKSVVYYFCRGER